MTNFHPRLVYMIFIIMITIPASAQLADNKCKFLGNVIGSSVPGDFLTYWNQVTPENSGKWESVEATRDNMNWAQLDIAYNFAKNNNLPFKQHTFIWGNQQPTWIETLPAEEQLAEIEEWISSYCARYPDTKFIDVVNEPLHDAPSGAGNGNYIAALGGNGITGWDWIVKSFELAREHCPDAQLLLNDYSIIHDNNVTLQYRNIVNVLKNKNLIDGIGIQGHRFELENATNITLTGNLTKLGETGLPVYITEFDLGNIDNAGEPDDVKQAELYNRIFPALWTHPAVHGITLWGYRQGETWMETAFLKRNDGTERAALSWLKSYVPTAPGGAFCFTASEPDAEGFSVYPNPVQDGKITIELNAPARKVVLMDAQGREVSAIPVGHSMSVDVDVTGKNGLYLLVVEGQSGKFSKKLIVRN